MTDFAGIINGINQATQMVGAVNGAINVMAPAFQSVEMAVNNVAGVVNPGYRQDMYAPPPGYYPPQYGAVPATLSSVPDESSIMGTVSSALGGAAVGALQGTKIANAIRPPKVDPGTEGISSKLSPAGKTILTSGLKAGGIGAAIGGVFSGIENLMKLSKNEITGAEATGNIIADSSVGFFTGIGGVAAGGLGAMAMGAMGMAGLPVTIGAAAVGLVGAVGMDFLLRKTGIRQAISDGIRSVFG